MPTIYRDVVTVGDISFNAVSPATFDFRIDEMAGWFDGPEIDVVISEFGVADGGSPGFFAAKSKYVEVNGWCLAKTGGRADVQEIRTQLGRAFPRNVDVAVTRFSPIPTYMMMRRAGPVKLVQEMPEGCRFSLLLVATDPFRYSVGDAPIVIGISTPDDAGRTYPRTYPLFYTGTVGVGDNLGKTFVNEGDANSYPISLVTGPLTAGGWQIINDTTQQRLTFNVTLTSAQTLEINHSAHTLKLNGYQVTYQAEGDWWALIPGSNFIRLTASDYNATAQLELHPQSAWE